jgi:hypothetical protein
MTQNCDINYIVYSLLSTINVVHIRFSKSQMISTLTKFFEKIIYIYHTKCIPYENIHREESNGIELVV